MIERFSSRQHWVGGFLTEYLRNARSYDRIAGYFSSSVLEVAGEALDSLAPDAVVRVVCNSELDPLDVVTARAAKQAMYREWCSSLPANITSDQKNRLDRLYHFLASGRLCVKILPNERFGLIHGKAGVITRGDGSQVCFLGSTNETRAGWALNYELVWADHSPEGVEWVQREFDTLWSSSEAVELADAVLRDVQRLSHRTVVPSIADWKHTHAADPASPAVEMPIYRQENGLWAHQKHFVKLAFDEHEQRGARFILADEVGLGKTVQLGLAAKLMVLWGGGRVLILVPKPLRQQWQEELWNLLALPSAVWNGRQWVDEQGISYPGGNLDQLRQCPRRVGIVSSGLVIQSPDAARLLRDLEYECVVMDEAHRARRRNLGRAHRNERAQPNNLLHFLNNVSSRARSVLLATATPVQLDPIEAWDLLAALNDTSHASHVLGTPFSRWQREPRQGLDLVLNRTTPPDDLGEAWEWMRDPLPQASEGRDFEIIRKQLGISNGQTWVVPEALNSLGEPGRRRVKRLAENFFEAHNPFIRHIVRRTRQFLETTADPETGEPLLWPIRVRLFGESDDEAILLPTFLQDAYRAAESFCQILAKRQGLSSGFLKTVLLRRVGSTIHAGHRTGANILALEQGELESDEDEDDLEEPAAQPSKLHPLTTEERSELQRFVELLEKNVEIDPKEREVVRLLNHGVDDTEPWLERGCAIFSQYYDSAIWLAKRLSQDLVKETLAVYGGASKSGVVQEGEFIRVSRQDIKQGVQRGQIRILVGTEAAAEGLNLQRLGALINLDLPWNPTRLEQRKGRIQRIGQIRDEVYVFNMRYRGSVEDRVHQLLSSRLQAIHNMFGQLPDTLQDVWVETALRNEEKAQEIIEQVPKSHPFQMKYNQVEAVDWESCTRVLDSAAQLEVLGRGW